MERINLIPIMIRPILRFLLMIVVSCLASCSTSKHNNKNISSGKICLAMKNYNNCTNTMDSIKYQKDPIIWYKDSCLIEEVFYLQYYDKVDSITGEQLWKNLPYEFTFIDLPRRAFYVFSSFSDTASLVRKYKQPDSLKGSIVNFWGLPSFFKDKDTKQIGDTIIQGFTYKRFKKIESVEDRTNYSSKTINSCTIAYLACNNALPQLFTLDKQFSEQQGCPVKRTDRFVVGEHYRLVTEIQYLSNKLTDEEEKVFKAWAKYAKGHPVEK